MTNVVEIVLEMILLGTVDAVSSRRVPMILRVLAAVVLLAVYLGLFALLLIVGVRGKSTMLVAVAFGILAVIAVWMFFRIKAVRRKKK